MTIMCPVIWTALLGMLVAMATPVHAQCNPSHVVVAIASILSTLVVVTVTLIGVYFFMRRRRQAAHKLPPGWEKTKNMKDGHQNRGYTNNEDNVTFEEGVTPSKRTSHINSKEQVLPRKNKDEHIWLSLESSVKHGRWNRGSLNGSLDAALNSKEPEIISVTLESQDIIGLGFNISGSYGDGIHISEVHNRGPAKESGVIKTGDRILSVTVSYQNIVYEDALTILSYASPYPVRIDLQKGTSDNLKNFVDDEQKGKQKRRIKHPLYHSRSLDTLKAATLSQNLMHRKRAISDLKLGSVKHFFNWHGNSSKKGHVTSDKDGTTFSKQSPSRKKTFPEGNPNTYERDVFSEATGKRPNSTYYPKDLHANDKVKHPGQFKVGSATHEAVAEVMPGFKRNSEPDIFQKSPPDKPERRNRRPSATQDSDINLTLENNQQTPHTSGFAYSISSVTHDEIDVDEDITSSDVSTSGSSSNEYDVQGEEEDGHIRYLIDSSGLAKGSSFVGPIQHNILQSPEADPLESTFKVSNKSETAFPFVPSDLPFIPSNNSNMVGELQNPSVLDDFVPSTHDWADIGEPSGHSVYDFASHHPMFFSQPTQKSNGEDLASGAWIHTHSENEPPATSEVPHHDYNFGSEFSNNFVTENSASEENNDHKYVAQIEPVELQSTNKYPVGSNSDESNLSMTFINGQAISQSSNSSLGDTNDGSEISDSLEWSGTRLVRSESISNIFLSDQ